MRMFQTICLQESTQLDGSFKTSNARILLAEPKEALEEQVRDPDLVQFHEKALIPEEAAKVQECFYHNGGVLMRK